MYFALHLLNLKHNYQLPTRIEIKISTPFTLGSTKLYGDPSDTNIIDLYFDEIIDTLETRVIEILESGRILEYMAAGHYDSELRSKILGEDFNLLLVPPELINEFPNDNVIVSHNVNSDEAFFLMTDYICLRQLSPISVNRKDLYCEATFELQLNDTAHGRIMGIVPHE